MPRIVNVQENPGKTVGGVPHAADPLQAHAHILRISRGMVAPLPYPKGVFKFATHEEADQWRWNHLMQAAVNKAPAPRR
jgi:hypothetical protein